jgi:hypothetical protein
MKWDKKENPGGWNLRGIQKADLPKSLTVTGETIVSSLQSGCKRFIASARRLCYGCSTQLPTKA